MVSAIPVFSKTHKSAVRQRFVVVPKHRTAIFGNALGSIANQVRASAPRLTSAEDIIGFSRRNDEPAPETFAGLAASGAAVSG